MVAIGLLELKGHHVDAVDNGQAAIDACRTKKYDLVLMDVEMPAMDGIEATRQIRRAEAAEPNSRYTPIVAMTAHAVSGFEDRCREAGMDDFITKPILPARLYAVVQQLAQRNERPVVEDPA
jgi:CheY-like chemotaxis protein